LQSKLDSSGVLTACPTFAELDKLTFTSQFIKEMMRYYPSVPIVLSFSKQPFQVRDVTIPANSRIVSCPYVTNHDGRVYKHADTFDPDRYSPERAEDQQAKYPPYAYIPQGYGPTGVDSHRCVGEGLMFLSFKLFLAKLLTKYDWKVHNDQKFELDWRLLNPLPYDRVRSTVYLLSKKDEFEKQEHHVYEIKIETGKSGTNKPRIVLQGTKGTSGEIEIPHEFDKGKTTTTSTVQDQDYGNLQSIQLFTHQAKNPWVVNNVFVTKMSRWYIPEGVKHTWTFHVNKSVDHERVTIPVETSSTDKSELDSWNGDSVTESMKRYDQPSDEIKISKE